ncbi:hypothetical protein LTR20_003728 [Exophiala xenobiotica]|nr:hypothetical protein LTR92_001332 [Exophiala xenobiotica]KAK5258412.1 hypothetical protein LTR40_007943 [Exophiala xenobiotica]KAK5373606.1 hypothetical protein LTS13_005805 [Exophiala xenobiotica]KAK5402286.1 hypothetical protein LTR79_001014 [Exophiala xenobiotica]KAK5419293.1 hypothetical protein LTR90_004356 [Exophiala xenobiotica]
MGAAYSIIGAVVGIIFGAGTGAVVWQLKDILPKDILPHRSIEGTTIIVVNGMQGLPQANLSGVEIYGANDTSRFLGGQYAYLPDFGSHTFPALENPNYIYITNAGPEPVCIAGIEVRFPTGKGVGISGNLGVTCGLATYESGKSVLPEPYDKAGEACVWVDGHGSNGIHQHGLIFDITPVTQDPDKFKVQEPEDLCKAPCTNPVPELEQALVKRSETSRVTGGFSTQLIKSSLENTGAVVRLCEGKTNIGPDFASLSERLYCDMDSREIHPFCEENTRGVCFDVDQDALLEMDGEASIAEVGGDQARASEGKVVKSFKQVQVWD